MGPTRPNLDSVAATEVNRALSLLQSEILEGLRHGFFDLSVSGELIKGGKRRLTIPAGKSYQFVISIEELQTTSDSWD